MGEGLGPAQGSALHEGTTITSFNKSHMQEKTNPFSNLPLPKLIDQYEQFYSACESAKEPNKLAAQVLRDTIEALRDKLEYLYLCADKFDQYERETRFQMLPSEERHAFLTAWTTGAIGVTVQINRKSIINNQDFDYMMPTGKIVGEYHPGRRIQVYVDSLMDTHPFYPDELIIKVGSNLDIRKKNPQEYDETLFRA